MMLPQRFDQTKIRFFVKTRRWGMEEWNIGRLEEWNIGKTEEWIGIAIC
ncbi:MAG: hypothetical protein GWP10_06935 [Nitrospiraceae bacterium]|nr:hypothetical protein [Nitrospiraceae bacterium]